MGFSPPAGSGLPTAAGFLVGQVTASSPSPRAGSDRLKRVSGLNLPACPLVVGSAGIPAEPTTPTAQAGTIASGNQKVHWRNGFFHEIVPAGQRLVLRAAWASAAAPKVWPDGRWQGCFARICRETRCRRRTSSLLLPGRRWSVWTRDALGGDPARE